MFDKSQLHAKAIAHQTKPLPRPFLVTLIVLLLLGISAFLQQISGAQPQRGWQIFLVNFLYFSGIAQGMVVFAAVLQMTNAKWGRPIKRLAEAGAYFLPITTLLLLVLYFGRAHLFPWIAEPIPEKEKWLNVPFLFSRDFIGLALLAGLSYWFLRISVTEDKRTLQGKSDASQIDHSRLFTLAPILAILYAVVYSLLAFDLIMSLDPHWYSTLFGAYYFITSFYTGMAALVFVMALLREQWQLEEVIGAQQFHDVGKLLFGFCVVAGDFFWSQFLVIWYGNIPEETRYVILRIREMPWAPVSYIVLFGAFAVPFVLMLSRALKRNPRAMLFLTGLILVGVWLEKFLLVVPSIWQEHSLPLGFKEIMITIGFGAGFVLVLAVGLHKIPVLPVSDPLLQEYLESGEQH